MDRDISVVIYPHVEMANYRIEFDYTNYKGETAHRIALVQNFQFGTTEHHKEPQWLCRCYDLEKQDFRDFAMKDMRSVAISPTEERVVTRRSLPIRPEALLNKDVQS